MRKSQAEKLCFEDTKQQRMRGGEKAKIENKKVTLAVLPIS